MSLHELLERVKAASGADRELDAEIDVALFGGEIGLRAAQYTMDPQLFVRRPSAQHVSGYANEAVPAYTASIDAAVALIERSGWRLYGLDASIPGRPHWTLHRPGADPDDGPDFVSGTHSELALAAVVALFEAKIAEDKP